MRNPSPPSPRIQPLGRLQRSLLLGVVALLPSAATAQSWQSDDGSVVDVPGGDRSTLLSTDPEAGQRMTLERLDRVEWSGWKDAADLLTDIHQQTGIPALAVACIKEGQVVARATVGLEAAGLDRAVDAAARFHLGSVTKSFTATLVGKLVEDGLLGWDSSLGEILEGIEMHGDYRGVTLEQLLDHRGGLPPFTDGPLPGLSDFDELEGTLAEKRARFLAEVLAMEPATKPGEAMVYSNIGYALAGLMAERVTGTPWEDLTRAILFEPLGMGTAGFGVPASPMGHAGNGPEFFPVPADAYPPTERIAPAGNVHCSVGDLARYAQAHLAGLAGEDGVLRAATVQRLHGIGSENRERSYAGGWFLRRAADGQPVHWHGGTIGASYAQVTLYPATRSAVIVLTTVGIGLGEAVASQVGRAMVERFGAATSGFVSATESGGGIELTEETLAPGDDERFWRVISRLSNAINDEDREAYRKLFAPEYSAESRDSMFDFMARNVLPSRGGIRSFHTPPAPFRVGDSEHVTRMVIFHLENGFPGYLGIVLDKNEKLIELSLFVKGDICPNGADRRCPLNTKLLDEVGR